MKNILVIGAAGQLGNAIYDEFFRFEHKKDNREVYDVYFTDVVGDYIKLDCLDYDKVLKFCKDHNINFIVNCAAYTNVKRAEEDVELCEKLNVQIPMNLSNIANEIDATLIHISSDYVYSGLTKATPFKEEDTDNIDYEAVKGVYGKTKFGGDKIVSEICNKFFVIRTSWLYYEGFDTAFPKKILDNLDDLDDFNVVYDQIGTPTYAEDLANAILTLIDTERTEYGVYNFSNLGVCSWYDFAKEIERAWRYSDSYEDYASLIKPIEYTDNIRPYYSVMSKDKFIKTFNYEIPYWKESLEKYLKRML